jgi:uncharacterized protein YciI
MNNKPWRIGGFSRRGAAAAALSLLASAPAALRAQSAAPSAPASAAPGAEPRLFAVEIRTGPAWDAAKPPQEQAHFRDHSRHLNRLREQGSIVLGARYGDKGLIVLSAASEAEAHALMQPDPSMQAKVFVYELFEFNVFYGGAVQPRRRRPGS